MLRRCFLFVVLLLSGAALRAADAPLILISMDAWRWDYLARYPAETPNLQALAREGVTASGLIPMFPSNTFPNHYSIVTGLTPANHGIINNIFFDSEFGEYFRYNIGAASHQSKWWRGEPIWVTARKQGQIAAVSFWPGSETEIGGVRPNFWKPYDNKLAFEKRFEEIAAWLRLPPAERPKLIVFYMEEANGSGHKNGPVSPELAATVKMLDERIGKLTTLLRSENIAANLVFVSDHGMTPISTERVLLLDGYIKPEDVHLDFDGPVVGLRPKNGDAAALMRALAELPHARAYRTEDLPPRWRVQANARTPAVWIVPEEGWEIYFRATFEGFRPPLNKGDHGYDPAFTSMHGLFLASGPAFKRGIEIPAVENIHIYNLLCAALGLQPAANDGDDRLVRAVMR